MRLVLVLGVFLALTSIVGNARAGGLSIKTFKTSYKGYKASKNWMWWLKDRHRCADSQKIYGARPKAPGNYPVLIYIPGTISDWSGNREGQAFVKQAAAQGFVAMTITYDTGNPIDEENLNRNAYCMFDQKDRHKDAISAICSVKGADCSKGVVLAGFSQGAAIAVIAKNYNRKVKAVWAIGLSANIYRSDEIPADSYASPRGTRKLPNDKLRIDIGESTNIFKRQLASTDLPSLKKLSGVTCRSGYDCIQPDGSGYYIVANSEIKDGIADHCYWMKVNKVIDGLSCTIFPKNFDPGFAAPSSTRWSLPTNLDWLRSQL